MAKQVSYRMGMALILAAGFIWSLNGLALRAVGDAGTWQVLFYRSVGMVPVLYLWVARTSAGRPFQQVRATGWAGLIGGLSLVFAFTGAIYSMQSTTIANAVFLFAAAPLISAFMAYPVLGERVRPLTWVAIAIAAVGVFLMVRQGLALGAGLGNLAALASAAGFSAFTLNLRRAQQTDMMPSVLIGVILAIAVSSAVIMLRGESFMLPLRAVLIAMAMGAVLIAGGMFLFAVGARSVPAAEAGLLALVEVMLGPVWVWLFLGEIANRNTLVGGAVLLSGIILNGLSGIKRA